MARRLPLKASMEKLFLIQFRKNKAHIFATGIGPVIKYCAKRKIRHDHVIPLFFWEHEVVLKETTRLSEIDIAIWNGAAQ